MITLTRQGNYRLVETIENTMVLALDDQNYFAWINAEGIGEILCFVRDGYREQKIIVTGEYKLYSVKDEPKLTDLKHLELQVGVNLWHGYLLPTGLPTAEDQKNRIIPTRELITSGD